MSFLTTAPMNVSCPSCSSSFPVDPDRVPEGGVLAICSTCQRAFRVSRPVGWVTDLDGAMGMPGHGDDATSATAPFVAGEEMEEVQEWRDEASVEVIVPPLVVEVVEPGEEAEVEPEVEPEVEEALEVEVEVRTDAVFEVEAEPLIEAQPEPGSETEPEPEPEPHSEPEPEVESETAPEPSPEAWPGAASEALPAPMPEPPPGSGGSSESPPPLVTPSLPGSPSTPTWAAEAPTSARARFGLRDPANRAKRLARVLASDMITYNPARYADARRQGTLRQDFREEIEKSWEEYVEQVGEVLATTTNHFADALNEVLAQGEHLFDGPGFPF